MKNLISLSIILCLFVGGVYAQTTSQPERRVIDVSGSAEQMVIPDEFTFKITLAERLEKKEKITIEAQEAALRDELRKLGIDVAKDLSVFDISATFFRQKKLKDVLATKDYRLKVRDLNKILPLQDLVDRLNVYKLDLIDTDNSRMTEIRREVKIEAIKAAKAKAEYLLNAIGEKVGKAISIKEGEESTNSWVIDGQEVSNFRSGVLNSNNNTPFKLIGKSGSKGDSSDDANDSASLGFTATKVRFVITARFEIE
ncbi:MAG: SIMPL domain-containing protein [Acidobacteria bacterium]|nr:SIMPL domain-containing protein [Acidobacteriota bacterium]